MYGFDCDYLFLYLLMILNDVFSSVHRIYVILYIQFLDSSGCQWASHECQWDKNRFFFINEMKT